MVVPLITTSSMSSDPPVIKPVVVIVEEPVSIVPNPLVIEPEFSAPTVVMLEVVSSALSKNVSKSDRATCFIVPLSLTITRSAAASVVEEAAVSPSIILISAAVAVTPSKILSSAAVEVTPSKMFNSAVVDVTPSKMFNSDAVAVTPSRMFNSAAVEVTFVPPISSVVMETSPATVTTPSATVIRSVSSV